MISALMAAFIVVPIVEIAVIVKVGSIIGPWWTVLLLLVESALGAWIVKREGLRAWRSLNGSIRSGHLPSRELADGALVLIGGVLLLTPGFVTDVLGFLFVLPFTRPAVRGLFFSILASRYRAIGVAAGAARFAGGRRAATGSDVRDGGSGSSRVVPGEVISRQPQEAYEPPDQSGPRRT